MLTLLFDGTAYGVPLFILAAGLAVTLGLMNRAEPRLILPITDHAIAHDRGEVVHAAPIEALLSDRDTLDHWLAANTSQSVSWHFRPAQFLLGERASRTR